MKKILIVLAFLVALVGCDTQDHINEVCVDGVSYITYAYGITAKYDQYTLLPEVCVNNNIN